MSKFDWKKDLKHLYNPSPKTVSEVVVPPMNFIKMDGAGDPNQPGVLSEVLGTLYALSYTLKFACKKSSGLDYAVMPAEGLWWVDGEPEPAFDILGDRTRWRWTLMVGQPDAVTPPMFAAAVEAVRAKKNPVNLDAARFEAYEEGLVAQVMHLGPYSEEQPTIERLHAFIHDSGRKLTGLHHEVYLNDPTRTAPDKLRTIIRQPMY